MMQSHCLKNPASICLFVLITFSLEFLSKSMVAFKFADLEKLYGPSFPLLVFMNGFEDLKVLLSLFSVGF